ncbi:uncharacterized protein LOC126554345 [Aphis gossypii]|uniref:uncharacterized protein LOC126553689 n=1 Tax=Aphis gossypii TaxID=80765 RepID=UPI002158C95C|nr:uncharacterized protein LOC126553689 [Aphis gossypii]XP_050065386.1 uncharacterized protein LOC126554345 [Aphis gossypii]
MYILFGFPPKSQVISDFVSSWIRVTHPLVNAIYTDDGKQQLKPFKFTINDFDAYNMKRERWYLSTLGQAFTPDEQTLADMDRVFNKLCVTGYQPPPSRWNENNYHSRRESALGSPFCTVNAENNILLYGIAIPRTAEHRHIFSMFSIQFKKVKKRPRPPLVSTVQSRLRWLLM